MGARSGKAIQRKRKSATSGFAVGFVGGGNMATALARGMIAAGIHQPSAIVASDVDAKKRSSLKRQLGIATTDDNQALVRDSQVIVLAVKPQIMDVVLETLRPAVSPNKLFISIVAGVSTSQIEDRLGPGARVVRVMPNTPALLGKAMSVVVRGAAAKPADEKVALRLLGAVGAARAVRDERLIDAVTGLSGSGPAYVYRFAEALIEGGVDVGLSRDMARDLALQTIAGAAAMLQESGETPARLRQAVTSPGGTTQAGLEELARRGFVTTVARAVRRATERSRELGGGK